MAMPFREVPRAVPETYASADCIRLSLGYLDPTSAPNGAEDSVSVLSATQ